MTGIMLDIFSWPVWKKYFPLLGQGLTDMVTIRTGTWQSAYISCPCLSKGQQNMEQNSAGKLNYQYSHLQKGDEKMLMCQSQHILGL